MHGEIIIPIRFRSIVTKLFKKQSVQVKLVGEEFNYWLKQFLHTPVSAAWPMPNISQTTYNDLFNFLEQGKIHLNNAQIQLLYTQCVYGYYLELFYQTYMVEYLSGRVTQTFKVILKENFNISDSYGRRLQWVGKLWAEYGKIGQLSMTLNEFYSHRQQVDSLFRNYPHLASEWKIIVAPNNSNSSNQNISTNHLSVPKFTYSPTNPFFELLKNGSVNMETS